MKRSPQDQDLSKLLGPSKFSGDGFLGNDVRPPEEIIAEDIRAMQRYGPDIQQKLVAALKEIYRKAESSFGAPTIIAPDITATYVESRGKTPSPFRGEGMFSKGEVDIEDNRTGKRFIITALSINLIEKHDFFQGRGSRYRIEPAEFIDLLGLSSS